MPYGDHTSITIHNSVYKVLQTEYTQQKEALRLDGVNSFSAYIAKLCMDHVKKKRSK